MTDKTVDIAEKIIRQTCSEAVAKLNEVAPDMGWDSGESNAEMRIKQLHRELESSDGSDEVDIYEDVYEQITDILEPYVVREGSGPEAFLPASAVESVSKLMDMAINHQPAPEQVPNAQLRQDLEKLLAHVSHMGSTLTDSYTDRSQQADCNMQVGRAYQRVEAELRRALAADPLPYTERSAAADDDGEQRSLQRHHQV